MTEIGDEAVDPDLVEQLSTDTSAVKNAWQRTLDEMDAMAAELADDGWDVTTAAALHTAPESPDAKPAGRFGLTHVIPDNHAEPFSAAFEPDGYDRYEVYRSEADGSVFQLTVLYDASTERAIVLAGAYEQMYAESLVRAAMEHDEMYTHVQTLDGTHLGSFRHEDYTLFFPNAEQRYGAAADDEA